MSRRAESRAYRVVGGILPPSLERKIRSEDLDKASLDPKSYHLALGENLRDGASRSWSYLKGAYHGWRDALERQPDGMDDTRAQFTRERWLMLVLRELGYGNVPPAHGGITIDGTEYLGVSPVARIRSCTSAWTRRRPRQTCTRRRRCRPAAAGDGSRIAQSIRESSLGDSLERSETPSGPRLDRTRRFRVRRVRP